MVSPMPRELLCPGRALKIRRPEENPKQKEHLFMSKEAVGLGNIEVWGTSEQGEHMGPGILSPGKPRIEEHT
jgi:hypothetical protein